MGEIELPVLLLEKVLARTPFPPYLLTLNWISILDRIKTQILIAEKTTTNSNKESINLKKSHKTLLCDIWITSENSWRKYFKNIIERRTQGWLIPYVKFHRESFSAACSPLFCVVGGALSFFQRGSLSPLACLVNGPSRKWKKPRGFFKIRAKLAIWNVCPRFKL